jgi:hypothetical protein
MRLNKSWFSVGARMALQSGKAGMKVSGNTTRFAALEWAWWMREMHFWVVFGAERKKGEAWQAAARRSFVLLMVDG